MHFLKTFVSFSAFLALRAYAAPLPAGDSFDGEFELDAREHANLEAEVAQRDLAAEELEARAWGLNKHPKGHSFKTPTGKYSGDEVNKAAKDALKKAQSGQKDRGYPKPGSGFRKSEAKADPTKGKGTSFHAPLKKKGSKEHPGPDRVIVHKKPGKTRFDSHVAYHDGKKPVPKGTGSRNHPFTAGKKKTSGGETKKRGGRR